MKFNPLESKLICSVVVVVVEVASWKSEVRSW